MLSDAHREFLKGSAIGPEFLDGVESDGADLVFTLTGPDGRTIRQRRLGDPGAGTKYMTDAGVRLVLPVPQALDYPARLLGTRNPVVVVEGTKQHLAAATALAGSSGQYAVVGLLGCHGWMHEGGRPLPDMHAIDWEGRDVFLALDADVATNPAVWDAAKALTDVLTVELGAGSVRYVTMTGGATDGFDDVLARAPEVKRPGVAQRLLDRAATKLPRRPAVPRNPYIGPGGLLVDDLFRAIDEVYPLAALADMSVAAYRGGRYHNGQSLMFEAQVSALLGNDFRPAHEAAVRDHALRVLKSQGRVVPPRQGRILINCRNGLLDPVTLELHPHTPEWRSTVQYDVDWDPAAVCPLYDAWVVERVGADQVEGLEQMASMALDPKGVPMRSLFLFGPSRSGKSTFARLMKEIVGRENCSAVRLHDMEQPFSAAEMYGKVLNLGADLPAGHIKELSIFKNTTGGDDIEANRKYGRKFRFTNHALSVFTANEVATVGEMSGAYFERMHPVFFGSSYAGRVDPDVEERLVAEKAGVFRRLVMAMQRRLLRLGAQPVPPPESVMRRFQDESDPVRKFLSEMTVADGTIEPTPLHAAYVRWCKEDGGREPLGRSDFGDRVTEAGFPVRKSNGRRVRDLRLRLDSDEEASDRDAGDGSGDKKLLPIQKTDEGKGSREALLENNDPNDPVVVDLETADARDLYRYGPGFVRLVGVDGGIGTDPGAVVRSISAGVPAVAHNGLAFDFAALARYHGLDYLAAVDAGLLIDSKVLAVLHDPPGARMRGPARYYGLDATAERLGVRGKVADLKALARKHGGYDRIPVDDPEYREYLRGDVAATRAVFDLMGMSDYARREMRVMGRLNFAMRVTGWRVDAPLLAARIAAGQRVVDAGMQVLVAHGLPVVKADGSPSKRPHTTKPGREAVAAALAAAGVRSWPVTAGGALALGRDAWGGFEVPDAARALLEAVWSMNGVRTVYQTVDDHRTGDRVYSTVDPYQASGRLSIKDPGLTVMGKRGGRHVEREVFLPEPGCSMIAFDLNQVDARAVAMHSQDPAYMALFNDPGIDSHAEIAHMIWGDRSMREAAKAIGHGWNYGESLARISAEAGVPLEVAKEFDRRMREQFPRLVEWQAEVRALAESGAMLDNGFGRLMRPDPARAWTQGPALMGQGLARDLLAEGLLRLPAEVVGFLRGSIHDELCFSVPTDSVVDVSRVVLEAMQFEYRGVAVTAGATRPGPTWGHIYRKDGA